MSGASSHGGKVERTTEQGDRRQILGELGGRRRRSVVNEDRITTEVRTGPCGSTLVYVIFYWRSVILSLLFGV